MDDDLVTGLLKAVLVLVVVAVVFVALWYAN
jgi:hypothetical protein